MIEPHVDLNVVLVLALGAVFVLALLALGMSYQTRREAEKRYHFEGGEPQVEFPEPPYVNRDIWTEKPRVRGQLKTLETRVYMADEDVEQHGGPHA